MHDIPDGSSSELELKLPLLRKVVDDIGATTLVLRHQASLSWLLGARSHVPYTLDRSWFDVIIDCSAPVPSLAVVTNRIEAPRLKDTELVDLTDEWLICEWWQDRQTLLPDGPGVAADVAYGGVEDASAAVAELRRVLTPRQQADLREVCRDSALVATCLAGALSPRMTEYEVGGLIARGLLEHCMDPVTLLVAGGGRMRRHRHPLPLNEPIGSQVSVVFCGRRRGLISAVTRTFTFGSADPGLVDAHGRILLVERAFLDATAPGRVIGNVVAAGTAAYAEHGFEADEWHRHHQGGFTGWESREYPASESSHDVLREGNVVAWNPSALGAKVEDTALVTADGCELLVRDGLWPEIEVGGRMRPAVLEL